jgi:predicted aldo/keto reductase-like oxidoreductase
MIGLGGGHLVLGGLGESDAVEIVQTAVEEGITFFDTSWDYGDGESERRVGIGLQGRRDGVFLMTKVCARDRESAERQLHDSLRRLRTDVIDLWQFHEVNYDNDADWIFAEGGAIEAALAAREAGKIRFIGFTGHKSPHILRRMLEKDFDWDSCQMPINPFDRHFRSFQREILPELNRRGIAPIGMKSMGGRAQFLKDAGLTKVGCRRYALTQPIAVLVVGAQSTGELREDTQIARSFEPMSNEEIDDLDRRVLPMATDGRHEWFKTTEHFDAPYHRNQHGFPEFE